MKHQRSSRYCQVSQAYQTETLLAQSHAQDYQYFLKHQLSTTTLRQRSQYYLQVRDIHLPKPAALSPNNGECSISNPLRQHDADVVMKPSVIIAV
jgi:hypothetical protein